MSEFVTAINCIDGRVQIPISRFLKKRFNAAFVDMITCPGPVSVLSRGEDQILLRYLYESVNISISKHGSKWVAIAAHYDCAANNVSEKHQLIQIVNSILQIERWNMPVRTIGLWVNQNWDVEEVLITENERRVNQNELLNIHYQ